MHLAITSSSNQLVINVVSWLLLAGLLLPGWRAQAQTYEPGLLVRSTGDTLRGVIENEFWTAPPTFIRFRATPESPSQLFKPRQLQMVRFADGRTFRYAGLPIDHAAQSKIGKLPYGNQFDVQVDSLLAEVLVEGAVTLVRVAGFDQNTHYVLLGGGRPPLDLSERKYLRQTVDRAWLMTDGNNYRGQLGVYFGSCPAAYAASQKAAFTALGLAAVVETYNTSCGQAGPPNRNLLTLSEPRRKLALQVGVLGGLRYHRLEGDAVAGGTVVTDQRVHPFAGIYAEVLQPGRTFGYYGELSISGFRGQTGLFADYDQNGKRLNNTFAYRAGLATLRLGVRYYLPLHHEQQLLFGLGYELHKVLFPQIIAASSPTADATDAQFFYALPTILPNVGIGWRRQRLTLNIDGQMYMSTRNDNTLTQSAVASSGRFASSLFFGTNFAARVSVAYRLGHNPDAARPADARQ